MHKPARASVCVCINLVDTKCLKFRDLVLKKKMTSCLTIDHRVKCNEKILGGHNISCKRLSTGHSTTEERQSEHN